MSAPTQLVTIAIPTYNRARSYLPQALACAVGQTYRNIEIIVSDNCSTDRTPQFMASQTDPRIRYYRQDKTIAPNENFNFCIAQARGDYLLLLLDDELVDRDFVATCLAAAADAPGAGLIRTGLRVIDANGALVHEVPNDVTGHNVGELFLAWFSGKTALYLCNTLFRTDRLQSVGGLRSRHNLFQDVLAQTKVLASSSWVDVRAVKASARSHPNQFTYSARVRDWAEDALELLGAIGEAAPPARRALIDDHGGRFFAAICYSRANVIASPLARLQAYAMVYRLFGRRYWPPTRLVLAGTGFYRWLRYLKRRLKGQPSWAAAG